LLKFRSIDFALEVRYYFSIEY